MSPLQKCLYFSKTQHQATINQIFGSCIVYMAMFELTQANYKFPHDLHQQCRLSNRSLTRFIILLEKLHTQLETSSIQIQSHLSISPMTLAFNASLQAGMRLFTFVATRFGGYKAENSGANVE